MGTTGRLWLTTVALAVTLGMGAIGAAAAAAPTRAEYVSHLEQVCKPDTEATRRVMRGARADVRGKRLTEAAEKFAAAAAIFGGTVRKISAQPRPPADTAKLNKWLGYLRAQESYLQRVAAQLHAGNAIKAQRLIARFIHTGNLANNTVLAFGFDYCSFKFSRYG